MLRDREAGVLQDGPRGLGLEVEIPQQQSWPGSGDERVEHEPQLLFGVVGQMAQSGGAVLEVGDRDRQ